MLRPRQRILLSKLLHGPVRWHAMPMQTRPMIPAHAHFSIRQVAAAQPPMMDPYAYTSGRWLRNHAAETAARQLVFDFDGLCHRAVACRPGASNVVRWEKHEGSYNRAFVLHLDDGSTLVARVPFSAAGPPRLVTNSEVATMAYLRKMTSIPVPEVLDWSDDPLNPLKTEYIIMQHVEGVQLRDRWDAMSPQEHLLCVKSLALLAKEMYSLQFPAYGSIYFDSASVDARYRIPLLDGFFIGPSLAHRYWAECAPGQGRWYTRRQPNRGPWTTFEAFTQGLLDTGVSHFPPETAPGTLEYYGTIEENLELHAALGKVTAELSKDPRIHMVSEPKLFHSDLHMRNIFVSRDDATKIAGVIDWQSTTLDPILLYAHMTPDLCISPRFTQDLLEEEEGEEERNGDVYETAATVAEREKIQSDVDRCRKIWELSLYVHARKLHDARALDEALLRPYRQCFSTWQYGATATRDVLKELSARWSELALPGKPPYQPTDEELVRDLERSEDFQAVLTLEKWHQHALDVGSDGWVPTERWDDVLELHEEFYNNWMDAARTAGDEGMTEEKAAKMWPFDPPVSLRQIGRTKTIEN